MTRTDLGRGGGYIYQWECAVLLALDYLMGDPRGHDAQLHDLVSGFLGQVEAIHLEGKPVNRHQPEESSSLEEDRSWEHDLAELEDVNLLAGNKVICVQVKARQAESNWWTLGEPTLRKALYRFYCNGRLDEEEPRVRFVFLSNRGFNRDLSRLRRAIETERVAQSGQANTLYKYLQRYVAKEYPKDPPLARPCFDQLLNRLTFVEFVPEGGVQRFIEAKLQIEGVRDCGQAYRSLFTEFSKRSVQEGGSTITLGDLYEIVPDFFKGRLVDYVHTEPHRSIASYVAAQAGTVALPPLGITSKGVIGKIESILDGKRGVLKEVEAFVLVVATCIPYLLHSSDEYTNEPIKVEQIRWCADKLSQEPHAPDGIQSAFAELTSEVAAVANARAGFDLESDLYVERRMRDERVHLQALGALTHLANRINLDETVDPTPPPSLSQASYSERALWWRQAYVRGVDVNSGRVQMCIRLPEKRMDEYGPILVDPLDEEICALIDDKYDPILFPMGINLKYRTSVVSSEKGLPVIPDDEWEHLKQEVEAEQFGRSRDRLQQDIIRAQRLRESGVSAQVSQAEQMVKDQRFLEAAEAFALAAALLTKGREAAQARYYAIKAAEQYRASGDRQAAVLQYLQAVEVWLENASTPGIVTKQLEQAHALAVELNEPALLVRVLLAQAQFMFATLRDQDARRCLEQASDMLCQIADKVQQTALLRSLALQHATLAMVWEDRDTARQVLDTALSMCPETALDERLDLLQHSLLVSAERGDWETADHTYQAAQQMLDTAVEPQRRGMLAMHYGASLARRGALKEAYDTYSEAIRLLDGHADAYTLGLAYRNMQLMLLRNGLLSFADLAQHEVRRIDLFRSTQVQNRGHACELAAIADLSKQMYRDALKKIRLALARYWREGSWMGIESAYKTLAALNAATGRPVEALFAAIRAGDGKAVEQNTKTLRDTSNSERLIDVVESLLVIGPIACEQQLAATALGVLTDVIPPMLQTQVVEYLITLLQGPEDNQQRIAVHRNAVKALHGLVPQLTAEQTNMTVRVASDQLQQRRFWTVTEELLKLLEECFALRQCQVDESFYAVVADVMLNSSFSGHLRGLAESVAVHLARTAPPDIRAKVITHLKDHPDHWDRLSQLVFLKEPISEEQVEAKVLQILDAINPQPTAKVNGDKQVTQISLGGIRPRLLLNFVGVTPVALYSSVVDGLLEAVINEHNPLVTRSDAIWTLSSLSSEVVAGRADEVTDYLLWGSEGTLPRSSLIDWELRSQTDPFSAFRIDMGNVEEVRQSSLHALGRLYPHVDQDHQVHIASSLINASRDVSPVVRQGVAMALDVIDGDVTLPTRLLLALVVLLHDSDPAPCSWACHASGHLIALGLAGPFEEDVLEQLLNLAETSLLVDVRVGAAVGLRVLAQSERLGTDVQQCVLAALDILSKDVSFRVRRAAIVEPQEC